MVIKCSAKDKLRTRLGYDGLVFIVFILELSEAYVLIRNAWGVSYVCGEVVGIFGVAYSFNMILIDSTNPSKA